MHMSLKKTQNTTTNSCVVGRLAYVLPRQFEGHPGWKKLPNRAVVRGREHRLRTSRAGGGRDSRVERHGRSAIRSKSRLPPPPPSPRYRMWRLPFCSFWAALQSQPVFVIKPVPSRNRKARTSWLAAVVFSGVEWDECEGWERWVRLLHLLDLNAWPPSHLTGPWLRGSSSVYCGRLLGG